MRAVETNRREPTREISNKRPGYNTVAEKKSNVQTHWHTRRIKRTNRYENNTTHTHTHAHTSAHTPTTETERDKEEAKTKKFTRCKKLERTHENERFHGFERQRALLYTYVNEMIILYYKT